MEQKNAWALEPWAPKDEPLGDSPQTHREIQFAGEVGVNKRRRMTPSNREPRTAGRFYGLGTAWIDRRAAGHGFDQAPNGGTEIKGTRGLQSGAGRRARRLFGGQDGLRKRQGVACKLFILKYELWYDLHRFLFLLE